MEHEQTSSPGLIERAKEFIKDVRVEASKISWPSRTELRDSTAVVIITCLLVSAFLFVVDRILQSALGLLFR